ncbi:ketoacyl-ACP synthase III family protein [Paractinoplanes durhamensis]|uniref:ketoacyl-ACP synthase III family protein n=1 Tax=Paractinoplanes durhamensis TaxID=113563 RepID=UPI003637C0E6
MRVNDVYMNGIGVFRPEVMPVESAVEQGLFPAGEVATRGLTGAAVAGDLPAPDMAVRAAEDALKDSGLATSDLAALFYACVWHQGPDGWDPQHYLQRELIGDGPLTVGIREGCNGMLIGLDLAVGMLRADEAHTAAMVVASDNFGSPLIDRWSQGAGFTVLGDGASAMVLSKRAGFAQVLSSCTATFSMMEEAHRAGRSCSRRVRPWAGS